MPRPSSFIEPLAVLPREARRRLAGELIETLIAMLDDEDGDPDLEDGNDAEDLGEELEDGNDAEGDLADLEPSLGWTVEGRIHNDDGMDREQDDVMRGVDVRKARARYAATQQAMAMEARHD
jgi:hypothetical protein